MSDYYSPASTVQSGTTHWYHATPTGGAVISNIYFRFKGISSYDYVNPTNYVYTAHEHAAVDGAGCSKTFTLDFTSSCGSEDTHLGGTVTLNYANTTDYYHSIYFQSTNYDYVHIYLYDSDGVTELEYDYYANAKIGPARDGYFPPITISYNIPATYIGTTKYLKFRSTGNLPYSDPYSYSGTVTATVSYDDLGEQYYTNNPAAWCNGTSVSVTGRVGNNVWSSWVSAPATFFVGDTTEDITFVIGSALTATCEFKYTYILPKPITAYVIYDEVDDFTSYEVSQAGYATTLMSGTWPTISGLNYGNGSIILEFKPHVGVTSPATAWRINSNIFKFEYDYEPDKIGTVIVSRSTKLAGGTMNALISDWATQLTLSATVDTFLLKDVTGGATDLFYTLTDLATLNTPNYILSPNTGASESVVIVHAGNNATGRWFKVDSTITKNHSKFEEVVGSGNSTWYFTGSVSDVTAWYAAMVTQWEAPDPSTKELDPEWPVKVGSEIVYMYSIPASTTTSLTLKGATWPYRGQYGIAYSHHIGATAYCVPTVGQFASDNTMYKAYGPAEAYVSPLNIVEGHMLDLMAYNGLMNSTTAGTTARGVMPFTFLPASIGVGDWVYLGPFRAV